MIVLYYNLCIALSMRHVNYNLLLIIVKLYKMHTYMHLSFPFPLALEVKNRSKVKLLDHVN